MHSIKVEQLVRHFGKNVAVDDISFNVESGEIFGFLGGYIEASGHVQKVWQYPRELGHILK